MLCPACGVDVIEGAKFCHQCGAVTSDSSDPLSEDSVSITANRSDGNQPSSDSNHLREKMQPKASSNNDDPEIDLWQGAYSLKAMADCWIYSFILFIILGVILVVQGVSGTVWGWVVLAVLVECIGLYLIGIYRKLNISYHLTNRRLLHEKGILRRVSDRIEVIDMDDTTVQQKLVERFFGIGTIIVTSSDRTHPQIYLVGIENVKVVCEMIDEARRKERERRGLYIESI